MDPDWKTRDTERFALEGETVFQTTKRVIDYWREHQRVGCFDEFPEILSTQFPDIYGQLDRESLGILCSAIWLYLGQPVNKHALLKWFTEAVVNAE